MNKEWRSVAVLLAALTLAGSGTWGQTKPAETRPAVATRGHRPPEGTGSFNLKVPAQEFDLILARPEKNAVTLSVLAYRDLEGQVEYGRQAGVYDVRTPVRAFTKGEPAEVVVGALEGDAEYVYRLRWRPAGGEWRSSAEYRFHTARPAGASFTFTMTADAHLDEHTSAEVYLRTLANIRADRPDFHLDLGNLFMTDKHPTREEAAAGYLAQRYYLGQIGATTPVLLALGTHDGESSKYDDGTATSLATWSNQIRKRYFPNPVPDGFYRGNAAARPGGPLQNYYAWEWGDALVVVLDPFRYSARQRAGKDGDAGWGWSLGREQYQWLKKTLEESRAKWKFVVIHNLLSGDQASRGGVELAPFGEWGGKNADGSAGFKEHRPGWEMPVHQLLVENHVAAVFKAHDNFYARQELDGLVYLMVPQPSFAGNDRIRDLKTYGYKEGTFLGNSGHVRVTVSPGQVTTEYVRAVVPQEESAQRKNGAVADRWVKGGKGG